MSLRGGSCANTATSVSLISGLAMVRGPAWSCSSRGSAPEGEANSHCLIGASGIGHQAWISDRTADWDVGGCCGWSACRLSAELAVLSNQAEAKAIKAHLRDCVFAWMPLDGRRPRPSSSLAPAPPCSHTALGKAVKAKSSRPRSVDSEATVGLAPVRACAISGSLGPTMMSPCTQGSTSLPSCDCSSAFAERTVGRSHPRCP